MMSGPDGHRDPPARHAQLQPVDLLDPAKYLDPRKYAAGFLAAEAEGAELPLVDQLEAAIQSRSCGLLTALLPDADLRSERQKEEISKLVSSMANSITLDPPNQEAMIILGAACECHPLLAASFSHTGPCAYKLPDYHRQLQDCMHALCDPPVEVRYEVVSLDDQRYGVLRFGAPRSLPVFLRETTPEGEPKFSVWVREEDERHGIRIRPATSTDTKSLFVRYLRSIQPYVGEEDWIARARAIARAPIRSAYDLIRAIAGYLLADRSTDREMAVRAIAELGGLSDSTRLLVSQLLLGMISDRDEFIAQRAISALALRGASKHAGFLFHMINAVAVRNLQVEAVATLGEIGAAETIEPLKTFARQAVDIEIRFAVDSAIARIRARHSLPSYDITRVTRFHEHISWCHYRLAEADLLRYGESICERSVQQRWILSAVRIAASIWEGKSKEAYALAREAHAAGDIPDDWFEAWNDRLAQLASPWEELRTSYFVLEKHFMGQQFSPFVERTENFCERLFRLVSEHRGATFEPNGPRLDREWLRSHPEVSGWFKERKLHPGRYLGRPGLLALAQCLVQGEAGSEEQGARLEMLDRLERLDTALKDLRDRHIHGPDRIGLSSIHQSYGPEPKLILRTLRSAYGMFGPDPIGSNCFDEINSDVRQWLLDGAGPDATRDLIGVVHHDVETSPGTQTGTVTKYLEKEGYGFIRPDTDDRSIFVHMHDVIDAGSLRVGQRVAFEIETEERGPRASRVTLVLA